VEEAIRRARRKAAARGLSVEFLVRDALTLGDWGERFAGGPAGRPAVPDVFQRPGAGTYGPRRVSAQELYDAFAYGWEVESVRPCRIEVNPEFTEVQFSAGGPKAWFAVVRRQG
jgi:hypothetical protein